MKESVKLTQFAKSAGCAAKIGPKVLAEIVGGLPKFFDEHLLVGTETNDDGAVYQISDELALIQTLDFFPPVVDEPSLFGEIAAANALSDIYAMGGTQKIALNIVAFPNCLGQEVLGEILQGGAKKVQEAGAVLAGGHSINDEEPKYGLSVTGFVNPKKMWKNSAEKSMKTVRLRWRKSARIFTLTWPCRWDMRVRNWSISLHFWSRLEKTIHLHCLQTGICPSAACG